MNFFSVFSVFSFFVCVCVGTRREHIKLAPAQGSKSSKSLQIAQSGFWEIFIFFSVAKISEGAICGLEKRFF